MKLANMKKLCVSMLLLGYIASIVIFFLAFMSSSPSTIALNIVRVIIFAGCPILPLIQCSSIKDRPVSSRVLTRRFLNIAFVILIILAATLFTFSYIFLYMEMVKAQTGISSVAAMVGANAFFSSCLDSKQKINNLEG